MNNEKLRIMVKQLKIYQGISYKEISEYLEIRQDSFYNWLHNQYDFCYDTQLKLYDIVSNLME